MAQQVIQLANVFRFVATFADGTQIAQNEEDVSPMDETKNCYFDVLQRTANNDPPVCFVITDGTRVFGVDLRDGHFEINGLPFFLHKPEMPHERFTDFQLLYYRDVRQEVLASANGAAPLRAWVSAYTIGWTTVFNGETIERKTSFYLE